MLAMWLVTPAQAVDVTPVRLVQGEGVQIVATGAVPGSTVGFARQPLGGPAVSLGSAVADGGGTAALSVTVGLAVSPGPGTVVAEDGTAALAPAYAPVLEVLHTDRTVVTQADVDDLAWVLRVASGACLTFDVAPGITSVALPRLVEADCLTLRGGDDLEEVSLPGLVSAGILESVDHGHPLTLDAPRLMRVVEAVNLTNGTFHLPAMIWTPTLAVWDDVTLEMGPATVGDLSVLAIFGVDAEVQITGLTAADSLFALAYDPLERISLPDLEVAGSMYVNSDGSLIDLDLPSLRVVGSMDIDGMGSGELLLPSLERANSLSVYNTQLTRVWAPVLRVADDVGVAANPALVALELPSLRAVEGFPLTDNPLLTTLDLPSLRTVDALSVYRSGPPMLTLPALQSAIELSVGQGPVESVSAPLLHTLGRLSMEDNSALESLDLPSLTTVTDSVWITDNPLLPACDAEALVLLTSGTQVCEANDGTCGLCL